MPGADRVEDNAVEAVYAVVGSRIRTARKEKDWTQETLADRIDMTRTSITNIERGRQRMLLHTLVEIAKALDVAPASLLPPAAPPPGLRELLKEKGSSGPERDWIQATVKRAKNKEAEDGSS